MSMRSTHSRSIGYLLSSQKNMSLLSAREEIALARRIAAGDQKALHRLVLANIRLVVRTAKPYRSADMPFEDLVGEGVIGLIEAARRFDPDQGNRFITCAIWWIRKALFTALRKQVRLVRVPSFQMRKEREIRTTVEGLEAKLGRIPSRNEISEELGTPAGAMDRVLSRMTIEFSIDQPVADDSSTNYAELIRQDHGRSHEHTLIDDQSNELVTRAVSELPAIERTVIERRFGLGDRSPEVLREVGRGLGLSRERVRQIECQATDRLRKILNRMERPLVPVRARSGGIAPNGRIERGPSELHLVAGSSLNPSAVNTLSAAAG